MFTSACARVLSSPSRVARSSARSPQLERLVAVLRQHRELRHAAAGARELDRLAERLEDRDRLQRLRPSGRAVADEPVKPREHPRAPAHGRLVAELPVDPDRAPRRAEGVIEPSDEIGGRGQLLEQVRLLEFGEPLGEVRGPPVVEVGLPVGLERGGAAGRDQRVLAHHVLISGGLRVMHDLCGIGARCQQGIEHLGVQRRRATIGMPDRTAWRASSWRKRTCPTVQLEQLPAFGLLGRRANPASPRLSTDVLTRFGTAETSSTRRRAPSSSRDTRANDGVGDRGRRLRRVPGREQLGHVEGVPSGGGVELVPVLTGKQRHRVARERLKLEQHHVLAPDRAKGAREAGGREAPRRCDRWQGRGRAGVPMRRPSSVSESSVALSAQ